MCKDIIKRYPKQFMLLRKLSKERKTVYVPHNNEDIFLSFKYFIDKDHYYNIRCYKYNIEENRWEYISDVSYNVGKFYKQYCKKQRFPTIFVNKNGLFDVEWLSSLKAMFRRTMHHEFINEDYCEEIVLKYSFFANSINLDENIF